MSQDPSPPEQGDDELPAGFTIPERKDPPTLVQTVDQKDVIMDIYEGYMHAGIRHEGKGIMFKTTPESESKPGYNLPRYKFWTQYVQYNKVKSLQEASQSEINSAWSSLVSQGRLIHYNAEKHEEFFGGDKSFPYNYIMVNRILRGAEINQDGTISYQNITPPKGKPAVAKARIYILNRSPKQILVQAIESIRKQVAFLGLAGKAGLPAEMMAEMAREDPSTYLEAFEDQQLFAPFLKHNLRLYAKDIKLYLEGRLERSCECGFRLFTPPLQSSITGESESPKPPEIEVPEEELMAPPEIEEDAPEAAEKDSLMQKKQLPLLHENGGLTEVILENNEVLTSIDPLIQSMTRAAHYFSENQATYSSKKKARRLSDVENGNDVYEEDLTSEEFESLQREYMEKLTCPKCKKTLLTKPGFFKPNDFVDQFIDALEEGTPPVFVGYPGDGKSTMSEAILKYFRWRYGVPYEVYMVSEATTSGKLLGRMNLLAFSKKDEDILSVLYGIVTLCLLKKGKFGVGLGANLMLDEFNRAEFKHIAFFMSFLASPYRYLIDDDNYRIMEYPNRRGDISWALTCTMNTQDVNNEPISIAAKSRFAFINVAYTNEDKQEIIKNEFHLPDKSHSIIQYLLKIDEMTQALREEGSVRFPAGIRHLIRIHNVLKKAWVSRSRSISYKIASITQIGPLVQDDVPNLNEYGEKTIKIDNDADIRILLDKIVRTNLLSAIWDENSRTKQDLVNEAWDGLRENDSDFISRVKTALSK